MMHADKPIPTKSVEELADTEFKCTKCEKVFKHKTSLKRHLKQHEAELDGFVCDICNSKFTREDNLYKHRGRIHGLFNINFDATKVCSKEKIVCKMCNFDFGEDCQRFENHLARRSCLKKERTVEVNEEDKFECTFCERSYFDQDSLFRHIEWKHKNAKSYACEHCSVTFQYKSSLVRHKRKVHMMGK